MRASKRPSGEGLGAWRAGCYTGPAMSRPKSSRLLRRARRGAVSTEYVVLIGTVGLALVFALVAVGPVLIKNYSRTRGVLAAPFP
jgi:hypothetical protein